MREAPLFHPKVVASSNTIGVAFDDWVRHYNSCETCKSDEWYEPSGTEQMCEKGRQLFKRWDILTAGVM